MGQVKLLSGEDGGGIRVYRGDRIDKVTLVDLTFGDGIPVPHHDNKLSVGSEVFQILPDLTYKVPIWGINSIVMKDGTYHFDTDFTFGFDLVTDYQFTMKYLEPFSAAYKKFWTHKDFERVNLDDFTTWVRTYISPVFVMVRTRVECVSTVYELCAEFIKCWLAMYREAEKRDEEFKQEQLKRIKAQYGGHAADRPDGQGHHECLWPETFAKFFKAHAVKLVIAEQRKERTRNYCLPSCSSFFLRALRG